MTFTYDPARLAEAKQGGPNRLDLPDAGPLAERIRNGETPSAIAAEYGVTLEAFHRRLNRSGWSVTGYAIEERTKSNATAVDVFTYAEQPWMEGAICAQIGGDLWFSTENAEKEAAIFHCQACPVRLRCLEYALDCDKESYGGPVGIWGGLRPFERAKITAARKAS